MRETLNAKVSATKVCPGCSARYPPDALFCPNDGSPLSATPFTDGSYPSDPLLHAAQGGGSGHGSGGDGHDSYLGREISGHIEIRKLAGVGAMGRVYRAFQRGIDRDVAVKVLHRELSANQQLVARFHREAKVASRLQHPNVVQVHLAGQLPDGAMYIVMEFLDGLSLQSALAAAGGPLPLERALHIGLQICDAAGEAHSQGVVHRDIKPENVMLIRRGDDPDFVKVLDFGIARLNWGEQSMATAAGLIFGTARYISPEGAQGEAVGPEGDVYATATLLYQMLTGRTPFEGEQAVALLVQQIHDAPPPIRSTPAGAKVPEAIAAVIMRNLAKTPSDRAPDARTFGRALVEAAKTVGLTPEDLVPRSSLFVPTARLSDPGLTPAGRASSEGQVVSTQRDPVRSDVARSTHSNASGVATQLWTPPAAPDPSSRRSGPEYAKSRVALEGAEPLAEAKPSGVAYGSFPASGRSSHSSVDPTLDEMSVVGAPAALQNGLSRASQASPPRRSIESEPLAAPFAEARVHTEMALPVPAALELALRTPPPGEVRAARPSPLSFSLPAPSPAPNAALASQVPSAGSLGRTMDDVDSDVQNASPVTDPRARKSRLFAVTVICFLVGMLGASVALYELGIIGGGSRAHGDSLDDVVLHADDALRHARWDTPRGDNVRDITTDGLAKWPHDPRLLDLRARATDELVKEAVGRKFAGDLPGALHGARLANELDPTDTTAQRLVDEYQRETQKAAGETSPSAVPQSGPAPVLPRGVPHGPAPVPEKPVVGGPRVLLDASLPRPKVGQPVTFTAKVSAASGPAKAVDDPRFVINGPGLSTDTKLGALPEPGATYVATFAGFEPGRYDVTFDAKVDGVAIRATRAVVIEGDPAGTSSNGTPHGPASVTPPTLPSTVPSAKWL